MNRKGFTPGYVGSEMANDGAMQYYAYSTIREDFATAFEKTMMKKEFGLDYYVAFVTKPADVERYNCSELIVQWGVRNRLADPVVQYRSRLAVESIYGATPEFDQFMRDDLGLQDPMTVGVDWCTNRDGTLNMASGAQSRQLTLDSSQSFDPLEFEQLEAQRQRGRH